MQCPSCGTVLAYGITTCPRCGTFLPYTPVASGAANADVGNVASYNPSKPTVPVAPYPPYPQPSAPPTPYMEHVNAPYTPQGYPQNQQPPSMQPSIPPNNQYFASSPAPIPPFKQPRRGLSRGMMIFIAILSLLTMFSGFGLIYYTTVAHPAQLHAQATATVQTILTNDAYSTATANAQATGTSIAIANVTATANAQATAQVQATATALQGIYTSSTKGTPALTSSLAFQDGYNWDVYDTTDGGGCGYNGGAFHASVFKKGYYVACFAHATNYSNFALQVQMTILRGDEGGLIFRGNDTASKFYYFRIGRDGVYSLYVSKDNNHSLPLIEDNTPFINTAIGQSNLLTVVAKGSTLYFYINKHFVGSASDSTYNAGEIGIFAGDNNNGTEVAFSNARVWAL